MFAGFRRFVIGYPLPTASEAEQRLSKLKVLAIFSDALFSVAYAMKVQRTYGCGQAISRNHVG